MEGVQSLSALAPTEKAEPSSRTRIRTRVSNFAERGPHDLPALLVSSIFAPPARHDPTVKRNAVSSSTPTMPTVSGTTLTSGCLASAEAVVVEDGRLDAPTLLVPICSPPSATGVRVLLTAMPTSSTSTATKAARPMSPARSLRRVITASRGPAPRPGASP
jgi:hypothetical protein